VFSIADRYDLVKSDRGAEAPHPIGSVQSAIQHGCWNAVTEYLGGDASDGLTDSFVGHFLQLIDIETNYDLHGFSPSLAYYTQ
jgi:hypothetical protein